MVELVASIVQYDGCQWRLCCQLVLNGAHALFDSAVMRREASVYINTAAGKILTLIVPFLLIAFIIRVTVASWLFVQQSTAELNN